MNQLAATIGLLAGATAGYAQGVINWSDYIPANNVLPGFAITIWSCPPYEFQNLGNTSIDLPPGNAKIGPGGYTGTPLSGSVFEIGLYVDTSAAAVAADVRAGTPIATDNFSVGQGGWDFSGSLDATVYGIASGTSVFVELAAWQNTRPASSYAAAIATGDFVGTSSVSTGTTVLGGGGTPPAVPGSLSGSGITDFSVPGAVVSPEPSTMALAAIGASAFVMRLRRKQNVT